MSESDDIELIGRVNYPAAQSAWSGVRDEYT